MTAIGAFSGLRALTVKRGLLMATDGAMTFLVANAMLTTRRSLGGQAVVVAAAVQVDHPFPQVVGVVAVTPPLGALDFFAHEFEGVCSFHRSSPAHDVAVRTMVRRRSAMTLRISQARRWRAVRRCRSR